VQETWRKQGWVPPSASLPPPPPEKFIEQTTAPSEVSHASI